MTSTLVDNVTERAHCPDARQKKGPPLALRAHHNNIPSKNASRAAEKRVDFGRVCSAREALPLHVSTSVRQPWGRGLAGSCPAGSEALAGEINAVFALRFWAPGI